MNERIKELERQCWNHQTNHLDTEKFAEMIVRECARYVDRAITDGDVDGQSVKEHFGID